MPLLAARRPREPEPLAGPLVAVRGVAVRASGVELLAPCSLEVEAGERVAVTGRNGTGKTTLLRVIAGLTAPSEGVVAVAGRAPEERSAAHRRAVAALIGTPPFERDLTLEEHLAMVAVSWGAPVADARREAAAGLDALALAPLARRFPHELSSGQTQLFSLALVLARPSAVLLLDEPEQRLDVERVPLVAEVLRRAAASRALVVATHSPVLIEGLGARVVELERA
ncbi:MULTISPECIES: ATP-binding cassette domain-containing protein [unclassified Rathayibacter]|uniref:ABC transporter ATP-binding protein n=1 Tax=unclassified Rathayibacter TaxID=2609250 RepID=UPI000CE7D9AC|nr:MULTISPECIES: ATP-binding cassette domain-containing protein [unclassified Rathayibacter]PPG76510.1 multidrug ABC transporter ATP-binding protein [Rathayibacter sp. AY1E5]PPH52397.1 multidrug ABC transporter ATP-binding protein [Rathayibacter sp. AY1E2]PPI07668.1 multidrug ABC transporter ATP-binding protein [Rathayibacter sp. AY1B8]